MVNANGKGEGMADRLLGSRGYEYGLGRSIETMATICLSIKEKLAAGGRLDDNDSVVLYVVDEWSRFRFGHAALGVVCYTYLLLLCSESGQMHDRVRIKRALLPSAPDSLIVT